MMCVCVSVRLVVLSGTVKCTSIAELTGLATRVEVNSNKQRDKEKGFTHKHLFHRGFSVSISWSSIHRPDCRTPSARARKAGKSLFSFEFIWVID